MYRKFTNNQKEGLFHLLAWFCSRLLHLRVSIPTEVDFQSYGGRRDGCGVALVSPALEQGPCGGKLFKHMRNIAMNMAKPMTLYLALVQDFLLAVDL
jgi:hypothetical protein